MSSASTGATDAQAHTSGVSERPWTDTSKSLDERVESLLGRMTLEEKLAQLGSVWGADDVSAVEVMQDVFTRARPYDEVAKHGLGHLTRVLGTRPVAPGEARNGSASSSAACSTTRAWVCPRSRTRSA